MTSDYAHTAQADKLSNVHALSKDQPKTELDPSEASATKVPTDPFRSGSHLSELLDTKNPTDQIETGLSSGAHPTTKSPLDQSSHLRSELKGNSDLTSTENISRRQGDLKDDSSSKQKLNPNTSSTEPSLTSHSKLQPQPVQHRTNRRVFHLSHSAVKGLRHSISSSSLNGVHKRKHVSGPKIAILTEQRKAKLIDRLEAKTAKASIHDMVFVTNDNASTSTAKDLGVKISHPMSENKPGPQDNTPSRKRPNASAAEKKWRREQLKPEPSPGANELEATIGEDDASLALAAELQKFAMAGIASETTTPKPLTKASTKEIESEKKAPKPLKFAPKPPLPRKSSGHAPLILSSGNPVDNNNADTGEVDATMMVPAPLFDPEDWVIDTFVRAHESDFISTIPKQDRDASPTLFPQAETIDLGNSHRTRDSATSNLSLSSIVVSNETNVQDSTSSNHTLSTAALPKENNVQDSSTSTHPLPSTVVPKENIGYLIIRSEDEEAWEWYAQSEDGDEKADREYDEDADSNAESFYANSYPSEEEEAEWLGSDFERSDDDEGFGPEDDDDY